MKKIFLRKFLPMALCLLMVVPFFAFSSFAVNMSTTGEPGDRSVIGDEKLNWAAEGQGYHSSVWNLDRHSKYLNNGTYDHSYQFWAPNHWQRNPSVSKDHDNTKEYVGFTFDEHYLVEEIIIFTGSYSKGQNNIKYSVDALILGEWQEIGYGYQDDGEIAYDKNSDGEITKVTIKVKHPNGDAFVRCNECKTVGDKTVTKCAECGSTDVKLYNDINTNNIRIRFTEYGEHAKRTDGTQATSHDWWLVPNVQEIEVMAYTGYKPEFDVPMGAFLVTNAAISGMLGASGQSQPNSYPGRAGDNNTGTTWMSRSRGSATLWATFDQMYAIENVGLSLPAATDNDEKGDVYTYNIYILKSGTVDDGEWELVVENATASPDEKAKDFIHNLKAPTEALAMKVEFTSAVDSYGDDINPKASELHAQIADGGKCIFLGNYMTEAKKASSATGNLACYGTAYASSNFTYASVSKVTYLIDGNVSNDDECWIALNYIRGTYAGVTLKETHEITKVVLYFNDVLGGTNGQYVFNFDIQAKVNGEFVTVGNGTSYDAEKQQYLSSVELETPVYTDDIRIVFTSDAQTFPYIKEIEIFSGKFVYSSYASGFTLDSSRIKGGPKATTNFAYRTVIPRGEYFNKISPISYFNIATEHGVDIDWLG